MANFARGTHALGECDRCGLTFRLHELRCEIVNGQLMNDRVCPDCWNPDHPQLQVGKRPVFDIEALFNPRPDRRPPDLTNIRWGWRPVYSLSAKGELGIVTIVGAVDTDPVTNPPPQAPTVFTDFILPAFATSVVGETVPSIGIEVGVDGVVASTFVGATSQIQSTMTPDGVFATGAVGTTTQTGTANIGVSSVTSTMLLGTPAVAAMATMAVSGVAATGAVGDPAILLPVSSIDIVLTPDGVQGSGSVGSVTATGGATTALTGLSATTALGVAQGRSQFAGTATGVTATGAVGTTTQRGNGRHTLTGVTAVSAVGSVGVSVPMLAPQLATTSTGTLPSTASTVLSLPSGTVQGDLLVLEVSTTGNATLSMPVEWVPLLNNASGATTSHVRGAVFYKIAVTGEIAPTITVSPAAELAFTMSRITGFDTTTPIDASSGNTGTGPTVAFPSITTTVSNTRIMAAISLIIGTASSTSQPEGYNLIVDQGVAIHAQNTSHRAQPTVGSTGVVNGTITGAGATQPWVAQLVAIRGTVAPGGGGGGGTTSVSYTASTAEIANPERGWFAQVYDSQPASYYSNLRTSADMITITRHYVVLDAFRRVNGSHTPIPQSYLDGLNTRFAAVRSGGGKLILRFSYDDTEAGLDVPVASVLLHLDQLAPVIRNNADIIMHWEAGIVGGWGEWAYSSNYGFIDNTKADYGLTAQQWADRKAVVDKILSILRTMPYWRKTSLRTPTYMFRMYGSTAISDANRFNDTDISRIGQWNDAFVANSTDFHTYKNRTTELQWLAQQSKWTCVGGESEYQSGYGTCSVATSDMATAHWTYCSSVYNNNTLNLWKSGGCYDAQMSLKLGYRLRLVTATLPTTLTSGGQVQIAFSIVNDGYAAPINKHPLRLVLRNTTTAAVAFVTMQADCRDWQPGTTHNISETVTLPPLGAGSYELLLNLCDEAPSLASNPLYSIRLANNGTWESATGFNKLNHTATRP